MLFVQRIIATFFSCFLRNWIQCSACYQLYNSQRLIFSQCTYCINFTGLLITSFSLRCFGSISLNLCSYLQSLKLQFAFKSMRVHAQFLATMKLYYRISPIYVSVNSNRVHTLGQTAGIRSKNCPKVRIWLLKVARGLAIRQGPGFCGKFKLCLTPYKCVLRRRFVFPVFNYFSETPSVWRLVWIQGFSSSGFYLLGGRGEASKKSFFCWKEPCSSDNRGPFSRRWEIPFSFVFLHLLLLVENSLLVIQKAKFMHMNTFKSLRGFRKDNNHLEKSDACILNICKWQKVRQRTTPFSTIYLCMYIFIVLIEY